MIKLFFDSLVNTFFAMAPYMMFGLFFVGVLKVYVKKDLIMKTLGKNSFGSVIKAALIGVPLPLCSCGVIPTALELKKDGASNSAVSSFLISTPQTGIDSIAATYSLMGPFMAIYRPIIAFIAGIFGGAVVKIFNLKDIKVKETEVSCCSCEQKSEAVTCSCEQETEAVVKPKGFNRIIFLFKYAYGHFLDEISKDFVIGLIIAALISAFLPPSIFVNMGLSQGILPMLIMIAIGIPMYVCSTSSIPIAISLMLKGLSPGVAFVFLFAGPVTNAASVLVLKKALGKKTTALYIISVIISALLGGLLCDYLVNTFNLSVISLAITNQAMHSDFSIFTIIISSVFLVLLMKGLFVTFKKKK